MKLEELNKTSLLQMLDFINTESDDMLYVVDKIFNVQWANLAFKKMFKKDESEIYDHAFGDVLGCGNRNKDGESCAFTSYCGTCEIRKNFHDVFNKTSNNTEFELVREFDIADEILIRHIKFKITTIELNGTNYALCMMKDLSNNHSNTIQNN